MNDLYIVLIVTMLAWLGIFLYLLRIEGQLKKLERRQ